MQHEQTRQLSARLHNSWRSVTAIGPEPSGQAAVRPSSADDSTNAVLSSRSTVPRMDAGGGSVRPLLFLDVDGPLIPFGGAAPSHRGEPGNSATAANPLLTRIDPAVGLQLAALGYELVWATTWEEDANECVAPRLGLPRLPVVRWPDCSEDEERDVRAGRHWKTRPIVAWAAGRAFAWVDDEITGADRAWVAAHHEGPALLHRVDPRIGLGAEDFAVLTGWRRSLDG